jgi:hypothetical protein
MLGLQVVPPVPLEQARQHVERVMERAVEQPVLVGAA